VRRPGGAALVEKGFVAKKEKRKKFRRRRDGYGQGRPPKKSLFENCGRRDTLAPVGRLGDPPYKDSMQKRGLVLALETTFQERKRRVAFSRAAGLQGGETTDQTKKGKFRKEGNWISLERAAPSGLIDNGLEKGVL